MSVSYARLIDLAIGAFGIQFAMSLQMANTTSVFKFLGASSATLSLIWLAAPITGLIMQPVIGQISDVTWTKYGKRNPYIFFFSILSFIALIGISFSTSVLLAALGLWVFGCSVNACMEALRALTSDVTSDDQKPTAFSLQTIFSGLGAGLAAAFPWMLGHIITTKDPLVNVHSIPIAIKITYIVAGILFLVCSFWQVYKVKEKAEITVVLMTFIRNKFKRNTLKIYKQFFKDAYLNIKNLPQILKDFFIVQFFTWTGMFCMWMYFSITVSQRLYGLPANADTMANPTHAMLLNKGTMWSGVCFGVYQFVSVVFALFIPKIAAKFNLELIHAVALFIGFIGLGASCFLTHPMIMLLAMIGVGIMWGSIMTMPYAIIAANVPESKIGIYFGVFNITVTLPQIVTALLLGPITTYVFRNHAVLTIFLGSILILVAAVLMMKQYKRNLNAVKPQSAFANTYFKLTTWVKRWT